MMSPRFAALVEVLDRSSTVPAVTPESDRPTWLEHAEGANNELTAHRAGPPLETPENVARLRAALGHLSANCPRSDWLPILISIRAHCWTGGEALGREWSASAPAVFDEADFAKTWASLSPSGGITAATVYYRARAAGWSDTLDPVPVRPAPEAPRFDGAAGDIRNAHVFAEMQLGRMLRVDETGQWLSFDEGDGWRLAAPGAELRAAEDVVMKLHGMAAEAYRHAPEAQATKQLMTHVRRSSDLPRLSACASLAAAQPGMTVRTSALDADREVLGVRGGVLCLRTCVLMPHSPDRLITKQAATAYDPGAECPKFDEFIERVLPDPEDRAFAQRWFGLSLTGRVDQQCFLFLYGTGANGKSVFVETMRRLLGDYAVVIPTSALMTGRRDAGAPAPELVQTKGARIALFGETEENKRLDEAQIKYHTSGEGITGRGMYSDPITWSPTHKLIGTGNHRPVITGTDEGIWRRLHLLHFAQTIPEHERDPHLLSRLDDERPGILNWALDGLRDLNRRGGLCPPASVRAAVQEYRDDCDVFGQWLESCATREPAALTKASDVYASYSAWAVRNGLHPMSSTAFGRRLTDRGLPRVMHGTGRDRGKHVRGLALKPGFAGR